MGEVVIISGAGDYADPWHPFAATSARLAELIASLGHRVQVSETVEESLLSLDAQLVVINIGNPIPPRPASTMIEIQRALLRHLDDAGGLLGMHVSATSFTGMPRWPEILGGHWVRGTTMHPPLDLARIRLHAGFHPVASGSTGIDGAGIDGAGIEVLDERYSYLDVRDDAVVLGDHEHDGLVHPMIWAREHGRGRVVYDGLGHDARSYDSPGHRDFLRRAVSWLTADRA
ncbi:MAG TPA: ThuA domain-containing protein [Microlunatus sp.]